MGRGRGFLLRGGMVQGGGMEGRGVARRRMCRGTLRCREGGVGGRREGGVGGTVGGLQDWDPRKGGERRFGVLVQPGG